MQPDGSGELNSTGLDYYERLVDALLAAGIAPWLMLYHWDLPQALEDRGGWLTRETAAHFGDYAATVARRLADRVGSWTTINEPLVVVSQGYQGTRFAPGCGLGDAALPTLDMSPVHAASPSPEDTVAAVRYDGFRTGTATRCCWAAIPPTSAPSFPMPRLTRSYATVTSTPSVRRSTSSASTTTARTQCGQT